MCRLSSSPSLSSCAGPKSEIENIKILTFGPILKNVINIDRV